MRLTGGGNSTLLQMTMNEPWVEGGWCCCLHE